MGKRMTRENINDYLKKGYHVHIRKDDGKGNKVIVESIFVVEIPYYNLCDTIKMKIDGLRIDRETENVVVASRAFLSPRDKPNKRVPNEVIVGRILSKIEEGRGLAFHEDVDLCDTMGVFQTWLTMGLSPRDKDVKKIAVFRHRDPECMKLAEEQIKMYKQHIESDD